MTLMRLIALKSFHRLTALKYTVTWANQSLFCPVLHDERSGSFKHSLKQYLSVMTIITKTPLLNINSYAPLLPKTRHCH